MSRRDRSAGATPATTWLAAHGVAWVDRLYCYVEHGGTAESARQLGVDEHVIVKTLVMQDERARPLVVLMHGDAQVGTQALARAVGVRDIEPCVPVVAQRHSGYLVGGTSPFGFRRAGTPVLVERTILTLPRVLINGGRRGHLVEIDPAVLLDPLGGTPVDCARPKA